MTVVIKIFKTYVSLGNLGIFQGKIHCSPRRVPFSLGNLGPSPTKMHCSLGKLYFSLKNFSYSMGNVLGTDTQLFFAQGNDFLKEINLKNYLNVIWIFSSILFVEKNNWEKDIRPFN